MFTKNDAWHRDGVEKIASNTYRIPLPLPEEGLAAVNTYALVDEQGVVLIDAGADTDASRAALQSGLNSFGCTLRDIRRILVTHLHYDHFAQAIALREDFGCAVELGIGEKEGVIDLVQAPVRMPHHLALRLRTGGLDTEVNALVHRNETLDNARWEMPDVWLEHASRVEVGAGRVLVARNTPGHTRGHVVYHEPESGLLFSGDHLLPTITPSVGFEPVPARYPLRDYMQSLQQMLELGDCRVLPAHGASDSTSHERVREMFDHHADRLELIQQTVETLGTATALDCAELLPWRSRDVAFGTLQGLDRLLAVSETLAHLDVLVDDGSLSRLLDGDTWRYTRAG